MDHSIPGSPPPAQHGSDPPLHESKRRIRTRTDSSACTRVTEHHMKHQGCARGVIRAFRAFCTKKVVRGARTRRCCEEEKQKTHIHRWIRAHEHTQHKATAGPGSGEKASTDTYLEARAAEALEARGDNESCGGRSEHEQEPSRHLEAGRRGEWRGEGERERERAHRGAQLRTPASCPRSSRVQNPQLQRL